MTATFNVGSNSVNSNTTLEKAILTAIAEARLTCEQNGENSPNCAVAWDIVEELQAEKSHQEQAQKYRTSLDDYCEMHPDALECLIYDV
ncbi:Calvin cycle protein CP12 [Aliinostoc sp. HNIBRCY26]|uniref:Calvin cycle protein CP12 n=1 Tax=Aliinostoc sp. HNIBRCY26 TaxID=3418997 RepID=UPI003D00028C